MSTLRTYNLQSIDSGSVNIQLSPNAGAIFTGLTTAQSGLNVTGGTILSGLTTAQSGLNVTGGTILSGLTTAQSGLNITGGSVGIGTDNPGQELEVFGNDFTGIRIKSSRTGLTEQIGGVGFSTSSDQVATINALVDGTVIVKNTTSDTEKLRIDSDGNVSIGTDNPTGTNPAKLTVLNDPSTAVSYGTSDAFVVKSKNIDGTGISTIFAIRPFDIGDSAIGHNPKYNVALSGTWFHFDAAGQNFNYLADDVDRTYVGFYTGASTDQLKAGEYSTLNGDGEPTAFNIVNIKYRTANGLSFERGGGASADVSFKFKGKSTHGHDNIIVKFQGDSDALELRNHASGDYILYNTEQGNAVAVYDGTGGAELRYNNDGTKTIECDSAGIISPYIVNTTSTSTSNYVRIATSGNKMQRVTSSRRYKNNIGIYTGGLSRISTITPRTWNDHKSGENIVGFIAEELHESGYTDAVTYTPWFGGSEVGIGEELSPMVGNGTTAITKTGEQLDDEVEVVDGISENTIICDLVLAVQELTSRISALESN